LKILLLEDDILLSEIIVEHLEYYKYQVITAYTGLEAEEFIYSQKFDLLLLDINVPYLNGLELLDSFRDTKDKTPAIFITSMNSTNDLLKGFKVGANDYLKKPFEIAELIARIENIKRHFHIDPTDIIKLSQDISYDSSKYILHLNDSSRQLSKKEGDFLHYLISNRGNTLSTDEIIANIWDYSSTPSLATIRSYIKVLRRYLGEDSISTVRGVGYIFN
jgi:DNA-binding response OmpR family regulator